MNAVVYPNRCWLFYWNNNSNSQNYLLKDWLSDSLSIMEGALDFCLDDSVLNKHL